MEYACKMQPRLRRVKLCGSCAKSVSGQTFSNDNLDINLEEASRLSTKTTLLHEGRERSTCVLSISHRRTFIMKF